MRKQFGRSSIVKYIILFILRKYLLTHVSITNVSNDSLIWMEFKMKYKKVFRQKKASFRNEKHG